MTHKASDEEKWDFLIDVCGCLEPFRDDEPTYDATSEEWQDYMANVLDCGPPEWDDEPNVEDFGDE